MQKIYKQVGKKSSIYYTYGCILHQYTKHACKENTQQPLKVTDWGHQAQTGHAFLNPFDNDRLGASGSNMQQKENIPAHHYWLQSVFEGSLS